MSRFFAAAAFSALGFAVAPSLEAGSQSAESFEKEVSTTVQLEKRGNESVKLTVYPEAGRDSWTETYANPQLYEWLLSHSRPPRK